MDGAGVWSNARSVTRSDDDLLDFLRPDPGIARGYYALAWAIADPDIDPGALATYLGRPAGAGAAPPANRHRPGRAS